MKLYLVTWTDDWDSNNYGSFVVAAENEENALKLHPSGLKAVDILKLDEEGIPYSYSWYGWTPKEIKIECIGESNSSEEKVILASFNAG